LVTLAYNHLVTVTIFQTAALAKLYRAYFMPLPLGEALQILVIWIDWRHFCEKPANQATTLTIPQNCHLWTGWWTVI